MRKSTIIVKRTLALFLVVLMSINTMGAIVSDNDGSAFITKAEFDSLKNDFQSQIDQYNTSIDSKIDGAIASYLGGIQIATTENMDSLYDNSWKWSSDTTYSYDNVSDKKFYFNLLFYTRTAVDLKDRTLEPYPAFYSHWFFEPIAKADRTYNTMVIDNGQYKYKQLVFRWEGLLYFGRTGSQVTLGGDCGVIQWYNFWPNSMAEKTTVHTAITQGQIWWYDGHNTLYVDQSDISWTPIIAPVSTAETYYYEEKHELQNASDKGVRATLAKGNIGESGDLDTTWSRSDYVSLTYYPNQTVSLESNKHLKSQDLVLYDLKQKSTYNEQLKYGVCIGSTNAKFDTEASVAVKLKTSVKGDVLIALGDSAKNAWDNSKSYGSKTQTINTANTETTINVQVTKDSKNGCKVFLIFKPTSTSDLGTVNISSIILTKQ
ncbi:MAG: hypothetical protein J6P02_06100 [Lachnospiraceae bacterium]|nr:hypothetical protein [Lachnospiraceae bacterium]